MRSSIKGVLRWGSQLRMTEEDDESQSLVLHARVVSGAGVVVKRGGIPRIRGFLRWCLSMVSRKSAWMGVADGRLVEYATTPSVRLMQLWCGGNSGARADKLRSKQVDRQEASEVADRVGFFDC